MTDSMSDDQRMALMRSLRRGLRSTLSLLTSDNNERPRIRLIEDDVLRQRFATFTEHEMEQIREVSDRILLRPITYLVESMTRAQVTPGTSDGFMEQSCPA